MTSPIVGMMIFGFHIFQRGCNHQPDNSKKLVLVLWLTIEVNIWLTKVDYGFLMDLLEMIYIYIHTYSQTLGDV